jgi:hypothetical protein
MKCFLTNNKQLNPPILQNKFIQNKNRTQQMRSTNVSKICNSNIGPQGIQGPDGDKGTQGPQGPQGTIGQQGSQGSQGEQGMAGQNIQGYQGPQGPQGFIGVQGSQGHQGNVGLQGFIGTQGIELMGFQGAQGPQGPQNVEEGVQGFQGPQGFIGNTSNGIEQVLIINRNAGSQGIDMSNQNIININNVQVQNIYPSNVYQIINMGDTQFNLDTSIAGPQWVCNNNPIYLRDLTNKLFVDSLYTNIMNNIKLTDPGVYNFPLGDMITTSTETVVSEVSSIDLPEPGGYRIYLAQGIYCSNTGLYTEIRSYLIIDSIENGSVVLIPNQSLIVNNKYYLNNIVDITCNSPTTCHAMLSITNIDSTINFTSSGFHFIALRIK